MPSIQHFGEFLAQSLRDFHRTGSIAPSSASLARTMVSAMPRDRAVRALEVGAGSGAFTIEMIRRCAPGSQIDIVEINDRFAAVIEERVSALTSELEGERSVSVHCADILEFEPGESYDAIVCGLPFSNFPGTLVQSLIQNMLDRLSPGGSFTFFEYLFIRPVLKYGPGKKGRQLRDVDRIVRDFNARHRRASAIVLWNLPPARVVHMGVP